MSKNKSVVKQARSLVENCNYAEAQDLLEKALQQSPDDPDLNAELGLIYCLGQKEFEAADLLPKTVNSERHQALCEVLRDYFYCRSLLAQKVGVSDPKGVAKAKIVSKFAKGKPEGVGIKLSACLIVKNEEKHLERCLNSAKQIVDEIIVVDTGSTDRTVEIAERFGAKIGHFQWCDDFAAARNESLRLATGDWALWIDADEELEADGYQQIREALIRPQFAGYYFQIINFMDAAAEANTYVHTAVRLFRRIPGIEFTGRIHEQIINGFKERGYVPATLTKARIRHYGYQAADMLAKNKLERTIGMLEREVGECPEEPFHWFNLANAFSVAGRSKEAERAALRCVELIDDKAPYGPAAFQILSSALTALGRPGEAVLVCNKASEKGYDTIINAFERAHALYELKQYEQALAAIDRCLAMEWPIDLTGDYGIKTYKGHVLRSQILTALSRFEEAESMADLALSQDPSFGMALFAKAQLRQKQGNSQEAFTLFVKCASTPGLEPCLKFAAKIAFDGKDYASSRDVYQQAWTNNPADIEAWLGLIQSCEALEDWEAALEAYEHIGEGQIPGADLILNWGRALEKLGREDHALAKYAEAIERNPNNANAYFNCADLLYRLGHFEQAAHVYELGLRRDAANPQAWFCLGNCFARMNVVQGARTSYTQALILAPDHSEAKYNLEVISEAA